VHFRVKPRNLRRNSPCSGNQILAVMEITEGSSLMLGFYLRAPVTRQADDGWPISFMGAFHWRNVQGRPHTVQPLITSSAKLGALLGGRYASREHPPNGNANRSKMGCLDPNQLQDPMGPSPKKPTARNLCNSYRRNTLRHSQARRKQSWR
jgi:hypothetical protein